MAGCIVCIEHGRMRTITIGYSVPRRYSRLSVLGSSVKMQCCETRRNGVVVFNYIYTTVHAPTSDSEVMSPVGQIYFQTCTYVPKTA
jgi:hypothetical protein